MPKTKLIPESNAYGYFINVPFKKYTQFFLYLSGNLKPFSD